MYHIFYHENLWEKTKNIKVKCGLLGMRREGETRKGTREDEFEQILLHASKNGIRILPTLYSILIKSRRHLWEIL